MSFQPLERSDLDVEARGGSQYVMLLQLKTRSVYIDGFRVTFLLDAHSGRGGSEGGREEPGKRGRGLLHNGFSSEIKFFANHKETIRMIIARITRGRCSSVTLYISCAGEY